MDLRSRLVQLESKLGLGAREGQSLPVVDGQAAVSVAARLQRLAARGDASRRKAISPEAIAVLLRGELCADGVVLIEQRLPASQAHGRVAFSSLRDVPLTFLAGGEEPCREGLLFIDTETTGLAGGTGTVAFVLGLSRMEGAFVRVRQYFLLKFGAEAAMLSHALDWIRGATHLVSFNGKSFDVPLLVTRYRLARLEDPLQKLPHIDLLHRTRAAFRRNWPDCRLQTAEQHLLKLYRDNDTPGHLIPQIWTDFLRLGETRGLRGIVEHNCTDLLSLIALACVLGRTYDAPAQYGADPLGVARAHRRVGDDATALKHLRDHDDILSNDAQLELAALYARSNEWQNAVDIWETLANRGVMEAMERLAKYHEHRRGDFAAALRWTERMPAGNASVEAIVRRHQRSLARQNALVARCALNLPSATP